MSINEGQTVGIDLGTSYSAIAVLQDETEPTVLTNSAGQPLTASIVSLYGGARAVVGPINFARSPDPENIVVSVKRQMGNRDYLRILDGRRLNPEFISSLILQKLKADAERQIGPIANAVISVPYYFNEPCRQATYDAGRIAGLNVIDLVNEPTAATLAHAWVNGELGRSDSFRTERTALVYDLGGGTFDVTVVRYSPVEFRVIATDGDTYLGGLDWTQRLVDFVSEHFVLRFGADPRESPRAKLVLGELCDQAKHVLSDHEQTDVVVKYQNSEMTIRITRRQFEELTADLLQRTRDTTELVLEDCGLSAGDVDEVLLVGGSTYFPSVTKMLRETTGRSPSTSLNPRLAVAQGAAIHAAILQARATGGKGIAGQAVQQRLKGISIQDVNAHSLGVEVTNTAAGNSRSNHIMIRRNRPLPVSEKRTFYTTRDKPEGILIRLLEGETEDVAACTLIGNVRIDGLPPDLPLGTPVEVVYEYDHQRHIRVSARELRSNNAATVEILREQAAGVDNVDDFRILSAGYKVD